MKTRAREDQAIIGYLLGTASELEQSQIETRYFREPHFYEEMLALEEEVICDYLNDVLAPAERRQFEHHFLTTPRRRRKYESTRKLLTFIADQGTTQTTTASKPVKPGLLALSARRANDFLLPRLGFLWTLTSLAVLSFGVWMLSNQVSAYRSQVAQEEARQATTQKLPSKLHPKTDKQRPEANKQRNPLAEVADQLQASLDDPPALLSGGTTKAVVSTVVATLRPAHLRAANNAQPVALPAEAATVHLHLQLGDPAPTQFIRFNVVLRTLNGIEILRRQNLTPQVIKSDKSLGVDLPAAKLPVGRYIVIVSGITAKMEIKPVEEYFMSINRE
ncbi:MAG: hypothetical protein HYR56_00035 [Acidobacteria bacterium]|nr:hypothetical protein [Acidobacteriota bacterium]MBI3425368.1 hypothetical protein [Acidobacteriota bacterium]